MYWKSVLNAYPSQRETIELQQEIRNKVTSEMENMEFPELANPLSELQSLNAFIPLLAPVCSKVFKDVTGNAFDKDMAAFLTAFLEPQDASDSSLYDQEVLGFVIQSAFHVFLFCLNKRNRHVVPEHWNRGDCPFCGSYRVIGLDTEDKRELHCLACGHSWRFARVGCPSCNNHDHNTLGYFEVEGYAGVRVYYCRACTHYYKVINSQTRIVHDAETEDALTLELDDIAAREGFSPAFMDQ